MSDFKYRLRDLNYNSEYLLEKLLYSRGLENPKEYRTLKEVIPYSVFENEIQQAHTKTALAVENNFGIGLLVDSDADGYFSASMIYQYLKNIFKVTPIVFHHKNKEHGFSDKEMFSTIAEKAKLGEIKLVFVPDAGSNDVEQCKILSDFGCDVIITDHHEIEKENPYAILINPQEKKDYKNLYSSGALVTYKMLRGFDDLEWDDFSDRFLDLVGFSIISDSMDIRTLENKTFIDVGLSNIKNKLLLQFVEKASYQMNNEITINGVAFYIVPLINGMVRNGSDEEKEMMFRAFCEEDDFFDYQKRTKEIVKESIYERVVRLCTNAKSRQDRSIEKGMEIVEKDIQENNRDKNKILFCLANDDVEKTHTGLIAMRIANKYNKPCVLLRSTGKGFSGSIRNFQGSPLSNLKEFLSSLNSTSWIQGHANASGIFLTQGQLKLIVNRSNEKLKDYDFSKTYDIDFLYDLEKEEVDFDLIKNLYRFRFYTGQGIPEILIYLKNFKLNSQKIVFSGKERINTWKIPLYDSLDIIKFRCTDDDLLIDRFNKKSDEDFVWDGVDFGMDIVCKIGYSEFNGEPKYLLVVEDYKILE